MDRDEVEVHKNAKRERGQYPAILTELVWSIKDLLYGIQSTEKNDLRTCLFSSTDKKNHLDAKVMARAPISWLDKCRKYNHLIGYISNSNSNSNCKILKFKTNFCVCRFLSQNVLLKLININQKNKNKKYMVSCPSFLSLTAWRHVSEICLQERSRGRNLGELCYIRALESRSEPLRSFSCLYANPVLCVVCLRMSRFPGTELVTIFMEQYPRTVWNKRRRLAPQMVFLRASFLAS